MKKTSNTYKLAVCAIMVALGAVLSLVKVVQMPFGGSVTLHSGLGPYAGDADRHASA